MDQWGSTHGATLCSYCRMVAKNEAPKFRKLPVHQLRGEMEPFPNYTRDLRAAWMAAEQMKHRTAPVHYR